MTPEAARLEYRQALEKRGEVVFLRRYTGTGLNRPWFQVPVLAALAGAAPAPLAGAAVQSDTAMVLLAEDVYLAQFPVPVKKGDAIVKADGKVLSIEKVDDNTRRIAGTLVAFEISVRG